MWNGYASEANLMHLLCANITGNQTRVFGTKTGFGGCKELKDIASRWKRK